VRLGPPCLKKMSCRNPSQDGTSSGRLTSKQCRPSTMRSATMKRAAASQRMGYETSRDGAGALTAAPQILRGAVDSRSRLHG